MMSSETPEAIPPAPKLLPMRRATSSPEAPTITDAITMATPAQRPQTGVVQPQPEELTAPAPALAERLRLNPAVEPDALSFDYQGIASDLLHFVELTPNGGGGYRVRQVDPDSVYHALGLQAGDVIYSVDPPPNSSPDVAFLRAEVKLEVFRDGQSVWLTYKPDQQTAEAPVDASRAPPTG